MSAAKPCAHVVQAPNLEVVFVIDQHIHVTDGLARCRNCGAGYLFELADMAGDVSVFRLSALDESALKATVRSLEKGSCDVNRAHSEVFNLASHAEALPYLLVMQAGEFTHTVPYETGLPKAGWRTLACDGSLIKALAMRAE